MPPNVSYWTGTWDPGLEAISKEIETLRSALAPGAPVVAFSPAHRTELAPQNGVIRLSHKRRLALEVVAAIVERTSDVSHLFGPLNAYQMLRALRRKPLIFTVVIDDTLLERSRYDRVQCFVAETDALANRLADAGVAPSRIRIIHPGVDLLRFVPAPSPAGRFRLLFASTPSDVSAFGPRGIPLLVSAARRLPDVDFVLLWRKWGDEARAMNALAALDPPPNVIVKRNPALDMVAEYQHAHATVACFAPRYGKSCPNSVIEGLACGRPCIVSEHVGISALVARENAGVSVEFSEDGMVAGIAALRRRLPAYQEQARMVAVRSFDKRHFLGSYQQLYEQMS